MPLIAIHSDTLESIQTIMGGEEREKEGTNYDWGELEPETKT